jgi:5-enolpyruvylshikimate-3-phosphate synthase
MRPLVGVLCAGTGTYILDGVARMRERPIIDLVEALQQVTDTFVPDFPFYSYHYLSNEYSWE